MSWAARSQRVCRCLVNGPPSRSCRIMWHCSLNFQIKSENCAARCRCCMQSACSKGALLQITKADQNTKNSWFRHSNIWSWLVSGANSIIKQNLWLSCNELARSCNICIISFDNIRFRFRAAILIIFSALPLSHFGRWQLGRSNNYTRICFGPGFSSSNNCCNYATFLSTSIIYSYFHFSLPAVGIFSSFFFFYFVVVFPCSCCWFCCCCCCCCKLYALILHFPATPTAQQPSLCVCVCVRVSICINSPHAKFTFIYYGCAGSHALSLLAPRSSLVAPCPSLLASCGQKMCSKHLNSHTSTHTHIHALAYMVKVM